MFRATTILLVLTLAACTASRSDDERFGGAARPIGHARVIVADDPRFAAADADDSRWPVRSLYQMPQPPATFWIRREVDVSEGDRPLGLYVSMLAATETYWDGVLVGRSGTIARDGHFLAAGPIDSLFVISGAARAAGRHQLAIRAASPAAAARVRTSFYGVAVGDYESMSRNPVRRLLLPFAGLGLFLVIGVYYLAIASTARPAAPPLIFALLCVSASLLVIAESYRPLFGYRFDHHLLRLQIISGLTFAVALLLPLFCIARLGVRRRWIGVIGAALAATFAIPWFDARGLAMFGVAIGACAVIVAAELVRGRRDYALLAGVVLLAGSLLLGGQRFSDSIFFLAFAAFVACVLLSLSIEQRRQRRENDAAQLRASRLELELLKRTIQPHFLMNTLTAVMAWIEEEPVAGVRFLEALADELRILFEVSGEALITMQREVELCGKHLAVMSCRTGMQMDLVAGQLDGQARVPPATFHTLIENAISHNRYRGTQVVFRLAETRSGLMRIYVLDAPLTSAAAERADGVGLRYVKARLEESFPGRWRLTSNPFEQSWRTTIEVPA